MIWLMTAWLLSGLVLFVIITYIDHRKGFDIKLNQSIMVLTLFLSAGFIGWFTLVGLFLYQKSNIVIIKGKKHGIL